MAYESRNETVRYREKYPYSYDEKDRYIKYEFHNPEDVAYRRYRTEPQPGHDSCHPSATRQRIRLDTYDVSYTPAKLQARTDECDREIPCRDCS